MRRLRLPRRTIRLRLTLTYAVLFLLGGLAITGTPPFSLFQSEFTTLSAALASDHSGAAALFVLGVVTIFIGFLLHLANLSLGAQAEPTMRARECPWKFGAMILVGLAIALFTVCFPAPIYELVRSSAQILGGAL